MPLNCEISFDPTSALCHNLSLIFAGLSILEKERYLKIRKINQVFDFKKSGRYPNRLVLELKIEGKVIAIDISDGYQDIHSPEFMDAILENIDYYYKTSYDPEFAEKLLNKDKFRQFGLLFKGTCPGNVFEKEMSKFYFRDGKYKAAVYNRLFVKKDQKSGSFENIVSLNHYDEYNVMMWTRLWECRLGNPYDVMKTYPELTFEQAEKKAKDSYEMVMDVNKERVETIRTLKTELGEKFIGGLSDDEISRSLAPELIAADSRVTTRDGYVRTLKTNVVNVLSKGLNGCIGARYCETFAAGRAFLTDKLCYQLYGNVSPGQNYLEYADSAELTENLYLLLENPDMIHQMETNNSEYYNKYLRPDVLLKRVIESSLD